MTRLNDWPSRFAALVDSARLRPFEWGVHDCVMWSAAAVLACTGIDLAEQLRGSYSSPSEAARVLRAHRGLRRVAALAGPEIAPALATTGDVGLIVGGQSVRLGVCVGDCWLTVSAAGLVPHPFNAAQRAWGVGRG